MIFRFVCLQAGIFALAIVPPVLAQTAEEILQRSAQAISTSNAFSGRSWGSTQNVAPGQTQSGEMVMLQACEVLHRAPDDWLLVSCMQRAGNGQSVDSPGAESFVYQLGGREQNSGMWDKQGKLISRSNSARQPQPQLQPLNITSEVMRRMVTDPYAQVFRYWGSKSETDFVWDIHQPMLLGDTVMGKDAVWHIVGRNNRWQEVHLWLERESLLVLRSVVIDRAGPDVRRISEWYYDQVLDPKNLTDSSFINPQKPSYDQPMSVENMRLTALSDLLADFGSSPFSENAQSVAIVKTPEPPVIAEPVVQRLTSEQMAAIVLIESGDGQASGFLTKIRDVEFVVTNLHVLGPDPQLVVRNLNGEILQVQGIFGAVGRDVAILRVGSVSGNLVPADDVLNEVKIGDEVVVVGNRRGGRVATEVPGKVLGIGPGRIEVDAKFEPGNSGSPVVHLKSGKVIGVATYSETREIDAPSGNTRGYRRSAPKVEQRWFAYRLDGITQWEAIDLARWKTQYKQISDFFDDSEALYLLANGDLATGKNNSRIRPYVETFEERYARFASNSAGLVSEMQNFLGNLRSRGQSGVRELKSGQFYDYFNSSLYWKTNIKQQLDFRQAVLDRLDAMSRNVDSWRSQVRNGQGG